MSVVWEDEYDPSELGDGFQVETELPEDQEWDSAARWLADEYYNLANTLDTQERIERPNEVR